MTCCLAAGGMVTLWLPRAGYSSASSHRAPSQRQRKFNFFVDLNAVDLTFDQNDAGQEEGSLRSSSSEPERYSAIFPSVIGLRIFQRTSRCVQRPECMSHSGDVRKVSQWEEPTFTTGRGNENHFGASSLGEV